MSIPSDSWYITGFDTSYAGELPVNEEQSELPIQQESFEVLGANRKIVIRGFVLGHEGTFTAIWRQDEITEALNIINYLANNKGPHVLVNPFGETFYVEFGSQTRKWMVGGHLEVDMNWIEVAH